MWTLKHEFGTQCNLLTWLPHLSWRSPEDSHWGDVVLGQTPRGQRLRSRNLKLIYGCFRRFLHVEIVYRRRPLAQRGIWEDFSALLAHTGKVQKWVKTRETLHLNMIWSTDSSLFFVEGVKKYYNITILQPKWEFFYISTCFHSVILYINFISILSF